MSRSRLARVLPVSALATLVAVAVVARLQRRERPRDGVGIAAGASVVALTSSSVAASPLDRPPRGPSPPPAVAIDAGAPRIVYGDARHLHRSAARGPTTVRVGPRVDVDGPVAAQVTASPDEETLYAGTLSGSLVAFSRAAGAIRWRVDLGGRVYSTPLVLDDGTVIVGSDAKKLFAVSAAGAVLHRLELDGEVDTGPVLAKDGTVVVAAGKTVVSVRRGGDLAWRFAARAKVFTSPAISDAGLVVFGSQDHRVYALTSAGKLAWSVDLGADVDGAPAIADDGTVYVGTDRGDVVAIDARGEVRWRTPVGGFVRGVLSIARNGDVLAGTYGPVPRVVRVAPDGAIVGALAIRGTGAREFGIHGGPLEDRDGTLFFGAQDDSVRAIAADGAVRWRFETRGDVDAPLTLLRDGTLVIPSEDGSVTLLLP